MVVFSVVKMLPLGSIDQNINKMLSEMDCPVCRGHMERPIFSCLNGHSFCSCCNDLHRCPMCRIWLNKFRNLSLENLIAATVVRCPYHVLNCSFMSDALSVKTHMEDCEFGTAYECPLKVATSCNWKGLLRDLPFHMVVHRNMSSQGWFEGNLFVLLKYYRNRYYKICSRYANTFTVISCQYIGAPANANNCGLLGYIVYKNGRREKMFCPCLPITDTDKVFDRYSFSIFGRLIDDPTDLEAHKLYFEIYIGRRHSSRSNNRQMFN